MVLRVSGSTLILEALQNPIQLALTGKKFAAITPKQLEGISLKEQASRAMGLRKLAHIRAELYYSRFSILESLWVAARLVKSPTFNLERFSRGLRSIIESGGYGRVEEDSETFREALRLHMLGHRDMVDNILYSASSTLNLRLLTLDTELKGFIHHKGLKDTSYYKVK